jgi:COP9 signalosome complex subunit 7
LASAPEEFRPYLTLLQVFSYGTYASLRDDNLPPLSDAQKIKLRQLTLLTLARDSNTASHTDTSDTPALGYASLLRSLELSNARELEELVISAIYAGLINAQLDPKNKFVHINSVAALRDVAPGGESGDGGGAIGGLLSNLQVWAGRCEATLQSLEAQMKSLRADADRRAAQASSLSAKVDKLVEEEQKGGVSGDYGGRNSMLTVGAGSSAFPNASGGSGGPSAVGAANLAALRGQRYGKRGSGQMDSPGSGDFEDEAMDVDDDEDSADGKQRASRRKL